MKIVVFVTSAVVLMGCMSVDALGWGWETGHFIVRVTDNIGNPITNAEVMVETLNCTGLAAGVYQSHYNRTSATADTNGVVDVGFQHLTSCFDWFLWTPSHYSGRFLTDRESFSCQIVDSDYLDINTNAVDGLAKYNELKALEVAGDYIGYAAKFEPKSVTYTTNVVSRAVGGFYPKRNPQPMYAYEGDFLEYPYLPDHSEMISSNGIDYVKYDEVDYDLREGAFLPPWGGRRDRWAGKVSDFKIVRYSVVTNNVRDYFGWIEFAPGCGAYKRKKTGNGSFPSTYEADTNALFLSRIPYRYYEVDEDSPSIDVETLVAPDEYMVLRTRVVVDENTGSITNCHYSKILGEMYFGQSINFVESVFNPQPNDPNLEHDITIKPLGHSHSCLLP